MNNWMREQKKQAALETICQRKAIQQIITIEPAVANILALAADPEPRENRWVAYEALKRMSSPFVGWDARRDELRTEAHYDSLIEAIDELLPQTESDDGEVA